MTGTYGNGGDIECCLEYGFVAFEILTFLVQVIPI